MTYQLRSVPQKELGVFFVYTTRALNSISKNAVRLLLNYRFGHLAKI